MPDGTSSAETSSAASSSSGDDGGPQTPETQVCRDRQGPLVDDFTDTAFGDWVPYGLEPSMTLQRVVMKVLPARGSLESGIRTARRFDFADCNVFVHVSDMAKEVNTLSYFRLDNLPQGKIEIGADVVGLVGRYWPDGGAAVEVGRAALPGSAEVWLRITESEGTVYWDTSDDAKHWTQLAAKTTSDLGVTTTALAMLLGETVEGSIPVEGVEVAFDNVNLPP
jgi:hypothetical protein